MQTIEEKIIEWVLKREVVETILKSHKDKLNELNQKLEGLSGFERDVFVSKNNFMGLNEAVKVGEKILRTMSQLGF